LSDMSSSLNEIMACLSARNDLIDRVKALEEHLMSLDHGNEHGNDPRDGGWFD